MRNTWVFQTLSSLCDQKARARVRRREGGQALARVVAHSGSSAFEHPVARIDDIVECALALNERQALGRSRNERGRICGQGEAAIEAQARFQVAVVRAERNLAQAIMQRAATDLARVLRTAQGYAGGLFPRIEKVTAHRF